MAMDWAAHKLTVVTDSYQPLAVATWKMPQIRAKAAIEPQFVPVHACLASHAASPWLANCHLQVGIGAIR